MLFHLKTFVGVISSIKKTSNTKISREMRGSKRKPAKENRMCETHLFGSRSMISCSYYMYVSAAFQRIREAKFYCIIIKFLLLLSYNAALSSI